jgi:general secretion pathway protein G
MKRALSRRGGGFTIVEILVVVIIIGVLAALIAPKFFGRVGAAKQSVAKQKLAVIEEAVDMFRYDYGRFPERRSRGEMASAGHQTEGPAGSVGAGVRLQVSRRSRRVRPVQPGGGRPGGR